MNYIEQFMKDNDFKNREIFIAKDTSEGDMRLMVDNLYHIVRESGKCVYSGLVNAILNGNVVIEKIKPKKLMKLMKQLKEQGFGWTIERNYDIFTDELNIKIIKLHIVESMEKAQNLKSNVNFMTESNIPIYLKLNDMFLTKSDAEREVYRRELEFEMQEWAREHDCLIDITKNSGGWFNYSMFYCYIVTSETKNLAINLMKK